MALDTALESEPSRSSTARNSKNTDLSNTSEPTLKKTPSHRKQGKIKIISNLIPVVTSAIIHLSSDANEKPIDATTHQALSREKDKQTILNISTTQTDNPASKPQIELADQRLAERVNIITSTARIKQTNKGEVSFKNERPVEEKELLNHVEKIFRDENGSWRVIRGQQHSARDLGIEIKTINSKFVAYFKDEKAIINGEKLVPYNNLVLQEGTMWEGLKEVKSIKFIPIGLLPEEAQLVEKYGPLVAEKLDETIKENPDLSAKYPTAELGEIPVRLLTKDIEEQLNTTGFEHGVMWPFTTIEKVPPGVYIKRETKKISPMAMIGTLAHETFHALQSRNNQPLTEDDPFWYGLEIRNKICYGNPRGAGKNICITENN